MFYEGKTWTSGPLYPVVGDVFTVDRNINIKGQGRLEFGVKYVINGFGYGKPNEDGDRREFWEILDKYNTEQPPIHAWKENIEMLYDKKILTVL